MGIGERWLVWRLTHGDREACRDLIRDHHQAVYGYLRRLGADGGLAEDLSQETYARAWSRIHGLRQAVSLRSWLLTIARNEFFQQVRRPRVESTSATEGIEPEDPAPDALRALEAREGEVRLHEAVDGLEPVLRETVALHYFQDLSLKEVGVVMGVPAGTVKSRLNRALGVLRGVLEDEEKSHEGTRACQASADSL